MNLHELKNFLTLAELLHFGKAAHACNMSPSALTRSIQRTEEVVGQPLFLRDNRTVSLTPAGEKFRAYAVQAVRDWDSFREQFQDTDTVSGLVSIYASVTAVYSLLPNLLESYRSAYPDVQLELRTGSAEESVKQVLAGEIDLSVAALPDQQHNQLEFMPLTQTDLVFVAPKKLKDLPQSNGQLDLAKAPLVIPRSGLSRKRLDQWLKKNNTLPNINTEVSGNEGILAMVRLGCGIGVVPELVLERSPFRKDVRKIENAPALSPYVVGLCTTQKNLKRPAISALWQLAGEQNSTSD
ncbi:transcriptional regulator IlvY [Oceaniferula spumae]|uniref:Transcriptional regulator IlvY n=1 Tax=Oceaniferula spumae TaxID=2979115 RepID=A0AAT9FL59_9BACT